MTDQYPVIDVPVGGHYSLVTDQYPVIDVQVGGHNSLVTDQYPVIDVPLGGHYSPVNNVRGDILGGDTVHYDNVPFFGT